MGSGLTGFFEETFCEDPVVMRRETDKQLAVSHSYIGKCFLSKVQHFSTCI
jgi:hypothetical protein